MGILTYRQDKHLEFLKDLSNEELEVLVEIITKDKDGNIRESEDLTLQKRYKEYYPNHKMYWDLIAADYRYFGGNTVVNFFRSGGVLYEDILEDVCKKMKVNLPKNASVEVMENNLLMKVMEKTIEDMSEKERKELLKNLNIKTDSFKAQTVIIALQVAIKAGGFIAYQVAVIVANIVAKAIIGRGLAFAANAALMKYMAVFAGPVGWAITGLWSVVSVAGPAYRVTIPATIYIAAMRQAKLNETTYSKKCSNCGEQIIQSNAKFCPNCGNKL